MKERKITLIGRKLNMKNHDQTAEDIAYWLTKPPFERLQAVTDLDVAPFWFTLLLLVNN